MRALKHGGALRRELPAARCIPYRAHVSARVVTTVFGDYVQAFRLSGVSFETADDAQLNTWHARLNILWRNIASPNVALWTHLIRHREPVQAQDGQGSAFAERLADKYHRRLAGERLMGNELYLSLVYRPVPNATTGLANKVFATLQRNESLLALKDGLDICDKLGDTLRATLARYEPEPLGSYHHDGRPYSRLLEFLSLLANGERQTCPLPCAPLNEVLATSRLFFGTEAIEYRLPTRTRVGAMLGIKEYATPSAVGMYDRLLSAPFPFVLTQSFAPLSKPAAQALLSRQINRMANAGDFAHSQADELHQALDALTSNEWVMGEHHFSLQVLADDPATATDTAGIQRLKTLNDHIALARSLLADTGMTVAREDLALEAAFWAQLPGHFPMRPRKAPITSRNFAAMAGFHNYPTGRAHGNHWGEALALLATRARSPYHFSLHASDPNDPEIGSRRDVGHTFICGPTGCGKTVLIGFLVAMLSRQRATQIIFDKDRGLEILVRALEGEYLPLKQGEPTGFNPLQLPSVPHHIEFLKSWLRALVAPHGEALSVRAQNDLDQALKGTLALFLPERRLSRLVEFLDPTEPEGVHARLAPWCASTRGDYAWVFDNEQDLIVPCFASNSVLGFDVTEFLEHAATRAPITLYLFHLVRQLLDGRRLICWLDEFWRLLADPAFERFAQEGPKTWRKLNAVMCLATQSAGDVLASPIARTLIEQTPSKIFFPNSEASAAECIEGFGLTEREFKLLKEELQPGARQFLVKQGTRSVVCELDLAGFQTELNIISGRARTIEVLHRIMSGTGHCPALWLPAFEAAIAASAPEAG